MQISLTQKQAEERFNSIETPIKYKTFFHLQKGKNYSGFTESSFKLKSKDNVFFDFSGKQIVHVRINEKEYTSEQIDQQWQKGHLKILPEFLIDGENVIRIHFKNEYNNDGNGLHSSEDAKGGQFMYIQSEPYWINRVFPLFDQPDLKGHMQFHFLAHEDWKIISNTSSLVEEKAESQSDRAQSDFEKQVRTLYGEEWKGSQKYWIFKETLKMSTYLYSFNVGPYCFVEYDGIDGEPPCTLRIFYNQDLQEYIDVQKRYIFAYYIEAIKFYESYFQTKSPWEKYDTVICQEYTVGAMEFPGCITYTDRLIFRTDKPTPNQVSLMGHVIVHELAHMWFGDLVTMKWWNDLWLNESFADFMCYLCQSFIDQKIPVETTDAWTNFLKRKGWGYQEDQRDTTHPIACVVENTSKADSIFDGITYSKGASVLKQLYFRIGHNRFSNNLKTYFEKYSFSNATLHQFLEEIEKGGENHQDKVSDLKWFNAEWIEKAGLNEVQVKWDAEKQGKQTVSFKQTAFLKQHDTLRYHKMQVAFFNKEGQIVHSNELILLNQEETQIEIDNQNYAAILPNYGDWSFIKVLFDEVSLEFFRNNFSKLQEPLTKLLVLRALYDMVKDAKARGTDLIDTLIQNNAIEESLGDPTMLQSVIDYLQGSLGFVPKHYKDEAENKVFEEILRVLALTKDTNDINIMKPKLVSVANTVTNIERLKQILDGSIPNFNLKFTNEEKWRIIFRIHSSPLYTCQIKKVYLNHMKTEDTTDVGKDWQVAIDGLSLCSNKLEGFWNEIINKSRSLSYHKLEFLLVGFNSSLRVSYKKQKYMEQFFDVLPKILNEDTKEIGKTLVNGAIPEIFSHEYTIRKLKEVHEKINPDLLFHRINIQKHISDLETVEKAYKLYEPQ